MDTQTLFEMNQLLLFLTFIILICIGISWAAKRFNRMMRSPKSYDPDYYEDNIDPDEKAIPILPSTLGSCTIREQANQIIMLINDEISFNQSRGQSEYIVKLKGNFSDEALELVKQEFLNYGWQDMQVNREWILDYNFKITLTPIMATDAPMQKEQESEALNVPVPGMANNIGFDKADKNSVHPNITRLNPVSKSITFTIENTSSQNGYVNLFSLEHIEKGTFIEGEGEGVSCVMHQSNYFAFMRSLLNSRIYFKGIRVKGCIVNEVPCTENIPFSLIYRNFKNEPFVKNFNPGNIYDPIARHANSIYKDVPWQLDDPDFEFYTEGGSCMGITAPPNSKFMLQFDIAETLEGEYLDANFKQKVLNALNK